jgi:hypothetical protein
MNLIKEDQVCKTEVELTTTDENDKETNIEGELSSSEAKESPVTQKANNPLRDATNPAGRIQGERMELKDRLPNQEQPSRNESKIGGETTWLDKKNLKLDPIIKNHPLGDREHDEIEISDKVGDGLVEEKTPQKNQDLPQTQMYQ